ncbi:MAG TPA: hypothetical protein VJ861_03180 [Treponemataceae bacterium]|nr:hypothetical protein [Treponemataceae bacterium]
MKKKIEPNTLRILELKEKIKDEGYIQGAIQRIALVLSDRILDVKDKRYERL